MTSLPMCGFITQLVEHCTGITEVMGSNPVEALIFFYVAKYHLGKVKLEQMQPASVPIQLMSFRHVKYELMQPAVSPFGST